MNVSTTRLDGEVRSPRPAGTFGCPPAFFILRNTSKKVVLLEGNRIGHGATGHNAGQVTSYFERSFHELVEEFGLKLASEGQRSIEMAWELLDAMYTEAGLNIPFSRFTGYAGFSTFDQIVSVPQEEILEKLETKNKNFIALAETQKGVINSALFTEEVALYLLNKYKDRFSIFENTKVPKVVLKADHAILDAGNHSVSTDRVVLCTNGFENIKIFNISGLEMEYD